MAARQKIVWESYEEQKKKHWPEQGRHILAQYDDESIVVYQAYNRSIGRWAAENGKFLGAPDFSPSRMTWIKTNFLWMMYRSDWAQSKNQETILAISVKRDFFDRVLKTAALTSFVPELHADREAFQEAMKSSNIRLQWDPDHGPTGEKQTRRAVQLGLKQLEEYTSGQVIVRIEDVTAKVEEQRQLVQAGKFDELLTPSERVYRPEDETICKQIGLDTFEPK